MLRYAFASFACSAAVLIAVACGTDNGSEFPDGNVDAGSDGNDDPRCGFGGCDADNSFDSGPRTETTYDAGPQITLNATIRDFKEFNVGGGDNPDFEIGNTLDTIADDNKGLSEATTPWGPYTKIANDASVGAQFPLDIIQTDLDDAGIPQYTTTSRYDGGVRTATTHGKAFFDQWYRDVAGKNVKLLIPIVLDRNQAGVYVYDSAVTGVPLGDAAAPGDNPANKEFFPIDDAGFGNQGQAHNYSFTVELRTEFQFKGNETFTFSGDDDVFVFINRKLAMNIGGIHEAFRKTIDLAQMKDQLGLVVGEVYKLDFFQAERHRTESNLRIETTLGLAPPGTILK